VARHSLLATLIVVLVLTGCGPAPLVDPARGAIMTNLGQARSLTTQCVRAPITIEGVWQPTPADIAQLETVLGEVLSEKLRASPPMGLAVVPQGYYRQYAGVFLEGFQEKQFIYINGFHEQYLRMAPFGGEWRTTPVVVCGGGQWNFGALYDLDAKQISSFEFNPS
jgi:hypothetical protein